MMKYTKSKLALGLALAMFAMAGAVTVAHSDEPAVANKDSIGEATDQEKTFATTIMQATMDVDYKAFVANGDKEFHEITEKDFKSVCKQMKSRLKKGYKLVFLGGFNQTGSHVTLWKIAYDDHGDEDLLHLSVKNGKTDGVLMTAPFQ